MPIIAVLPSAVADQIAAGEVVERPASVVKELVENSLDAGATSIDVVVEEGGHKLIRVSDDGSGMDRDDVRTALLRHGTSKIRIASDLVGVSSFGFRGEALPAIASISRFNIETSPADGAGTALSATGGTVAGLESAARRRGTTVSVEQLFFNVPARKKFLRTPRSEWRAIVDAFGSIALTRPDVRFNLIHDGKKALTLPPVSSLRSRVSGIWGGKYAESLLDVDDVAGTVHTSGLVERPADVGTTTRRIFISINGRAVRDAGIVRAAEAAYRSTITAGLRPSLFLSITLPASSVDVNVHPAKAEVRFVDRWPLERAVETAVRRALGTFDASAVMGGRFFSGARFTPNDLLTTNVDQAAILSPSRPMDGLFAEIGGEDDSSSTRDAAIEANAEVVSAETRNAEIPELFQFRRTYIAFEHDEGLVLIDQHSAHERVLYEEFMRSLESGKAPAQRLLLPITLHLGPAEGDAFELNREYLEKLGFEIEGFGGNTLIVSTVPMPHRRFDAERCLRETLDALTGDRIAGTATRHEHLAATVACKAAIKAGEQLSTSEMRALFASLRDTTLPAHDVHGRSTIVQLKWDELDRRFGRK
ncbi:MAG TPA: DNA mismatch repair endonuclease MutL [Gemmatimonadaceae bacterium]|nr:DNA mismatch repair endonuclease MutL [Gemmatimonadaceae bacterium]